MQTVLIVEDWPKLRHRLDDRLRELGYFTVVAETAQEALGLMRTLRVDLLLAREGLVDVEGSTLAQILRRRGFEELVVVLQAEDEEMATRLRAGGVVDAVVMRGEDVGPVVALVRRLLRPVIFQGSPSAGGSDSYAPAIA